MNSLEDIFKSLPTNDFGIVFICFSFLCCVISSYILKTVYQKKSTSLSGKFHIGIILPILSQITFLVILIVKSSLALSLGLIGALSIVRFRTPIKEPEELIYLFFSIALGIGYGSGQVVPTTLIFFIIIAIIWFYNPNNYADKHFNYNLIIEFQNNNKDFKFDNIVKDINSNFDEVKIVRLENDKDNCYTILCNITLSNIKQIDNLKKDISKLNLSELKISFYESSLIT